MVSCYRAGCPLPDCMLLVQREGRCFWKMSMAGSRAGRLGASGVKSASSALDEYLAVAAARYTLPAPEVSLAYSKDPKEFAKQYYGFFSCEGQGLERVSGSNTCKDKPPESRGSNINPFPTKPLLDFDFLTGQERPGMVKDK